MPVFVRCVGPVLGQMRASGTILRKVVFALAVHALSTTRVDSVLILRALAAEMALLLANETHGEFESISDARVGAHPHGVACNKTRLSETETTLGGCNYTHLCCRS